MTESIFNNGKCEKTKEGKLTKKHKYDAGLDIHSAEDLVLKARSRALIKTGIRLKIPDNYVGIIKSRSGLAVKHGIESGAGVIDSTYRGEICVLLYNHSDIDFEIKIGDRIAQLLTLPININTYVEVDALDETERSENGFGSTGR